MRLDSSAKSSAGPLDCKVNIGSEKGIVDLETGEILDPVKLFRSFRLSRFALQSVSRSLLPDFRVSRCLRCRQGHRPHVDLYKSRKHGKAFFSGLQTCGSVWIDPVCDAKISERRRAELLGAMKQHHSDCGCVFMLTLTAPHNIRDKIVDLLKGHSKALAAFFAHRQVKKIFSDMYSVGQVRALEVTHGRRREVSHGWHPHHHILIFAGVEGFASKFTWGDTLSWEKRFFDVWSKFCVSAGLGLPVSDALKLHDGTRALQYITKWGLDDELTKGHIKKAIKGGETPFDFLRAVLLDPGDKQAGALFVEFARVFKGKRQLIWSPGLKERFGLGHVSDEVLAERLDDESAYLLGQLTPD